MSTIKCIESYIDKEKNAYGCFVIEPLETGQGITLGNSLRRTLLSDLTSFSITGVRINNIKHEFTTVEGVRDDILEIIVNLKQILFQSSFCFSQNTARKFQGFLDIQGPGIITAGMFFLPKEKLTILNPRQYICTITSESSLYIEIDIENGTGYELTEEKQQKIQADSFAIQKPNTLIVDTLFLPIRRVNYKIKLIHDTQGNIKESLSLEILTNGTISPQRSLQETIRILISLFGSLLITPDFSLISSSFYKKLLQMEEIQQQDFLFPFSEFTSELEKEKEQNNKEKTPFVDTEPNEETLFDCFFSEQKKYEKRQKKKEELWTFFQ